MKKLIILITALFFTVMVQSQDFKKDITTAKTSYTANKLEDTHFALQQALSEIDMIIGREVLKLLPPKIDTAATNSKEDRVSSNVGFAGATVHRSYGRSEKAEVEIISNSPLIATLNTLMNMPGGMMRDENNKTVKVQGYKAKLEKQTGSDEQSNYVLQIPFSSALLTFTVNKSSESEILKMAETLPLDQIAKLIQ
jgi:hypothetical protein